jgi:hypothetical protein
MLPNIVIGSSVTKRIKQVKQPRGGYINPKTLMTRSLGDGMDTLNMDENVHVSLVGMAKEAFKISLFGATIAGELNKALELLEGVDGLSDNSIVRAMKLTGYDVCFRASMLDYRPVDDIEPDRNTIENVRAMVLRSKKFFDEYGPKVLDGFTFKGGYTNVVTSGDGDFTTKDTLWDFKVSKLPYKKEHTLQLLMYWRMGLHSVHPEFRTIKYLGIFNPRLNTVSRIAVKDIPIEVIQKVEVEVIGYSNTVE